MVEHNLKVVEGLCDTITVLTRGRVLAEGSYAEVSRNPEVVAAYLGSDPSVSGGSQGEVAAHA
jgi:branched-chain amino acid transport system ATP-binding protein